MASTFRTFERRRLWGRLAACGALIVAACAGAGVSAQPLHAETVASGLDHPWAVAFLAGGRFLVTERSGSMHVVSAQGRVGPPLAGVPHVAAGGQGGLLDLVLDANFTGNRALYFCYSEPGPHDTSGTALARATLARDDRSLQDVRVIFRARPKTTGTLQFGCRIVEAREGTLYLMCGGDRAVFERTRPVLEQLSASLRYIGTSGQAAQVKALVNLVMNINTAGLAEGLGLGAALGLDLAMLRDVFRHTGAHSQVLLTDGEDMQNREHTCFFSAAHAAKDSGIACQLGRDVGLALPLAEATREQFQKMIRLGLGSLDKSGIAELTFKGRHG